MRISRSVIFVLALSAMSCSTKQGVLKSTSGRVYSPSDYYRIALDNSVAFEKSGFSDMGKYDAAEEYFNRAIAVEKGDADIWFNVGRLFFYAGEYPRAKEAFKNAIKYRKGFVEAYSMLSKTYINDGNMDSALGVMLKANEAVPDDDTIMNNTALIYIEMGNLMYAKRLSEKIIRRNPKFIPAYITLGNIYYFQKNYEYARFIYIKAMDEGGDTGEIYTNLGLVTSKIEGKDKAYDLLKKGKEKSPNNPYTHLNLGEFLLSSGDYEGAIEEFKSAIKINPRLVEAFVDMGMAYTNVNLFDEASESYQKALLYNPSYAETYFNYGVLLSDYMLKPKDALVMFKKFTALKSGEIKKTHRVYKYIDELTKRVKVN